MKINFCGFIFLSLLLLPSLSFASAEKPHNSLIKYYFANLKPLMFYINDNKIKDYDKFKSNTYGEVPVTLLPGDLVVFNFEKITEDDLTGFAIEIVYKDKKGNIKSLVSQPSEWTCLHIPTRTIQGLTLPKKMSKLTKFLWIRMNSLITKCEYTIPS